VNPRSAPLWLTLLGAALAPARAAAQHPPLEAVRPGPRPATASHGEPIAFARSFSAARDRQRVLVVYIENNNGAGALRSALFTVTPSPGGAPSLARAREDLTLAPEARAASLAWDGARGAVAYVVPRPPVGASPHHGGGRTPAVGVPASTDDPFGPSTSSGGTVTLVTLDAQGAPSSPPRVVFVENGRLWRAAVLREPAAWAVAWTGATVTDDEVRGTVRALRLHDDNGRTRPMASASGFSGDPGDTLRLVRAGDRTMLAFSGSRCVAREGASPPPPSANDDPSAGIDPPGRNPQPQAVPRRAPGPPIECGAPSLHLAELRADDTLGPLVAGPWLASDAVSLSDDAAFAALSRGPSGAAIARIPITASGFGAPTEAPRGAPLTLAAAPRYAPAAVTNLTRPSPDADVAVRDLPVAPPDEVTASNVALAFAAPRAVAASTAPGAPVVVVSGDRHALAFAREGSSAPALLATTPSLVHEAALLPDPDARGAAVVLSREGVWSGPVRYFALPPTGAPAALALDVARAVPAAPPSHPPRYALRAPLRYDEAFSRLFAHTRMLRAAFMRHENLAGMMAARPEAPTDPRMPGLIAVRRRLRDRWESSCAQLRARAVVLAREGAGDDVLHGVHQLCEIHPDLQLGVPVNPAL
jgi:hypothetical protein